MEDLEVMVGWEVMEEWEVCTEEVCMAEWAWEWEWEWEACSRIQLS